MTVLTKEQAKNNQVSTVPCSEMSLSIKAANSFDRRTGLLMSYGLIAGIIPTSIRKRSPQETPGFAFLPPVGKGAEPQKVD
jgi:hypothetical protein